MAHRVRRDARRIEILRSAAAAFRRRGYHGASTEEIARALDMTKGSLYYYFRNKEELLFFCHDYSLDILLELLARVAAEGGSADRRLARLIGQFVHMIIDELHGTALTLDFNALAPPLLRRVVAKRDRVDRGIRRILRDGMARGVFAPGDPKLLSFAILGAINWIPRWFDPRGSASSEQIGRAFADYLVSGLKARPGGGPPTPLRRPPGRRAPARPAAQGAPAAEARPSHRGPTRSAAPRRRPRATARAAGRPGPARGAPR
jgi:TetR/AcrR family transcriptional regulator